MVKIRNVLLGLFGLLLVSALAVETVERLVIDPRVVSSWSSLVEKYLEYREQYGPIVPPSVSYEDVYARLKAGDLSFLSENWQFRFDDGSYYVDKTSKLAKLQLPLHILILEDIQHSEIIVLSSTDGEKYKGEALFPAPAFTDTSYMSKLNLTAGELAEEQKLYAFEELAPRRIIWHIVLKPEEDALADLVLSRDSLSAQSISLSEDGGMMMTMSVPAEHTNDLWMGIEGTNVTVFAPEGFTNRVEIFQTDNLISNIWTIAVQELLPVSTNPATWTVSSPGTCGFFRAGNMDIDTDGDGLPDARESIVHKTLANNPDTDGDGMPDGWELQYGFNPLYYADGGFDYDSDGLSNANEYLNGTYPNDTDSEDDGMPDGWEVAGGLNPLTDDTAGDPDGDGVNNQAEYTGGTHPQIVNVTLPGGAQGSLVFRYDDDGRLTESHLNNTSSELYSLTPAHNVTNLNVFSTEQ